MDLLHNRYGNIDFILEMESAEALSFISFVFRKREDELMFQRWINRLQFEMSFDEFRHRLRPKPIKQEAEILADVRTILDGFTKERGNTYGNS